MDLSGFVKVCMKESLKNKIKKITGSTALSCYAPIREPTRYLFSRQHKHLLLTYTAKSILQ